MHGRAEMIMMMTGLASESALEAVGIRIDEKRQQGKKGSCGGTRVMVEVVEVAAFTPTPSLCGQRQGRKSVLTTNSVLVGDPDHPYKIPLYHSVQL